MKTINIFLIMILFVFFIGNTFAWYVTEGIPLYAQIGYSYNSTGPWFDNPFVEICTCQRIYFQAQNALFEIDNNIDLDQYYGSLLEEGKYHIWDFGDGTSEVFAIETTHSYCVSQETTYIVHLSVDDEGIIYDDPERNESIFVTVLPVINPFCSSTSTYQYDLTHQLPFCGTFAFGTIGGYVSCSAGGSVTSNLGNVQLNVSSAGGSSEINLLRDSPFNLTRQSFPFDQVNVLVQYKTSPNVCAGGEFEVFVSGDTTTHKLPVRSSIIFGSQNSYIQQSGYSDSMVFILNVLPQDFTKLNELVIRYTSPGGIESSITLEQVYLWLERRHL